MSNINITNLSYDSNMDSLAMDAIAGGRSSFCTTTTRYKFPWLRRVSTSTFGGTFGSFSQGILE
jgi:hypothetical protein